ncbi:MAG TPA: hypothetical protein PKZ24_07255 [Nitrospirales bacterium]|nr:hypothetical protein [Nitrospirales bacterium]
MFLTWINQAQETMELKLNIGYAELLELIRQLPLRQMTQLQADLEAELGKKAGSIPANKQAVLRLAGSLNDAESVAIKHLINEEFETIEGEW